MLLVSFVFTGAIGIFALIGGSTGTLSKYAGCNSVYTGVLDAWNGLGFYFQEVDQVFCSTDCPCDIADSTMFTSASPSVIASYNQWFTTDEPLYVPVNTPEATNFTGCVANNVQNATFNALQADLIADNSPTNATYFKQSLFAQYYADIETKFNCTGWCAGDATYTRGVNSYTINKYLFSDINK